MGDVEGGSEAVAILQFTHVVPYLLAHLIAVEQQAGQLFLGQGAGGGGGGGGGVCVCVC